MRSKKAKKAVCPHCPGETHTWSVPNNRLTKAKLVGLKICLPRKRIMNLLAIASTAARAAISIESVRNNRHSDKAEIKALLGSKAGSFTPTVKAYWVINAVAMMVAAKAISTSRSSTQRP